MRAASAARICLKLFRPGYTKLLEDIGKSVTQVPEIGKSVAASEGIKFTPSGPELN